MPARYTLTIDTDGDGAGVIVIGDHACGSPCATTAAAGERVVVEGQNQLKPGAAVSIRTEGQPGGGPSTAPSAEALQSAPKRGGRDRGKP